LPRSYLVTLLVFAFTLFTSATLLFLVEPMIGKMILPLLGGTPAVWNTCMVFFQAILLVGYGYAHFSTTWLGARKQAMLHLGLLVLPFFFLPLAVNRDLIQGGENPILGLLLLLSLSVGLPMFVVSTSAPLLQKWFANTSHPAAKDPYFLYGASNLGSMIALIGYPAVVEPNLRLGQQSFEWAIAYGLLAVLTAVCAFLLWQSPSNVETSANLETKPIEGANKSDTRSSQRIQPAKHGIRDGKRPQPAPPVAPAAIPTLSGEVTWLRVLRWVALAFVPSSLMLGATTYITTDIAAIPLLWVVPLALYLLSFIIVFSHVPTWLQWLMLTVAGVAIGIVLTAIMWDLDLASTRPLLQLLIRAFIVVGLGVGAYVAWWGWQHRTPEMLHRAMVLIMPLLVLGLLFFMLSELKTPSHWITWSLCMHLATLFVVSMVCHGELARDRPAPQFLTGYFLWMSVGGVLGGLFNALLAPVIFTGIVEYELVMALACFLAPPLEADKESAWGQRFDLILAGLFGAIGLVLIALRLRDHDLPFEDLKDAPWPWELTALVGGVIVGVAAALRARDKKLDRWMDLVLPLCLGVLFIGLAWGLRSDLIWQRVANLADSLHLSGRRLLLILTYGVPIVLSYTFVERSLRFALGVGAVLLASGFCSIFEERVSYQERGFFGVLKIEHEGYRFGEDSFAFRRLVHGTTLHGIQLVYPPERHDEPLTYYHRSGPIGEVMMVFNGEDTPPEKMNLGVIGLGTGSMAAYARPGQHLTFYDIDPIVKRLSFDEGPGGDSPFPYFTFVQNARERGAELELVMGDARLTMEKKQLKDSEKYGVIVVDAFSSDAIPIHLITREAVQVYLDKLAPDGLLCFHISNRHLDLRPVLYNLAREQYRSAESGLLAIYQSDDREVDRRSTALIGKSSSTWVVLSRSEERLKKLLDLNEWESKRVQTRLELLPLSLWPDNGTGMVGQAMLVRNVLDETLCQRPSQWKPLEPDEKWSDLDKVGVWTDDYSNLLSVFWW
jgi:hypothetical protein